MPHRGLGLERKRRKVRIIDVDRQQLEIVPSSDVEKRVAGDIVVNMHVEFLNPREIGFPIIVGDRGDARSAGGQDDPGRHTDP